MFVNQRYLRICRANTLLVNDYHKLFYPVGRNRVFWERDNGDYMRTFDYYAIVDEEYTYLITIVSNEYYLVLNSDAFDFALNLLSVIFSREVPFSVCKAQYLCRTGYSCQIQLARKIDVTQPLVNDGWAAFMVITNSYNKTTPLRFNFGLRNVITGASFLVPNLSIDFSLAHTDKRIYDLMNDLGFFGFLRQYYMRHDYDEDEFDKYHKLAPWIEKLWDIYDLEERFSKIVKCLKSLSLPNSLILPFICKSLEIEKKENISPQYRKFLVDCREFVRNKFDVYASQYGKNAYSFLMACGDFVGNYQIEIASNFRFNSIKLSNYLGSWAEELVEEARKPDFDMPSYLKNKSFVAADWLDSLKID